MIERKVNMKKVSFLLFLSHISLDEENNFLCSKFYQVKNYLPASKASREVANLTKSKN